MCPRFAGSPPTVGVNGCPERASRNVFTCQPPRIAARRAIGEPALARAERQFPDRRPGDDVRHVVARDRLVALDVVVVLHRGAAADAAFGVEPAAAGVDRSRPGVGEQARQAVREPLLRLELQRVVLRHADVVGIGEGAGHVRPRTHRVTFGGGQPPAVRIDGGLRRRLRPAGIFHAPVVAADIGEADHQRCA